MGHENEGNDSTSEHTGLSDLETIALLFFLTAQSVDQPCEAPAPVDYDEAFPLAARHASVQQRSQNGAYPRTLYNGTRKHARCPQRLSALAGKTPRAQIRRARHAIESAYGCRKPVQKERLRTPRPHHQPPWRTFAKNEKNAVSQRANAQ